MIGANLAGECVAQFSQISRVEVDNFDIPVQLSLSTETGNRAGTTQGSYSIVNSTLFSFKVDDCVVSRAVLEGQPDKALQARNYLLDARE